MKVTCALVVLALAAGCTPDEGAADPYVRIVLAPADEQPESSDLGAIAFVDVSEDGAFVALRVDSGQVAVANGAGGGARLCVALSGHASRRIVVSVKPDSSESVLFAVLFEEDAASIPGGETCPPASVELAEAALPIRLQSKNSEEHDAGTSADAGPADAGVPDA